MEEQATNMLLQGISFEEFKILYLVGITGIVVRFLFNLGYGIWWDPTTPFYFHFPSFIKGFSRVIVSFIILAVVIARFSEFGHHLVEVDFTNPTRLPAGTEVMVKITAGAAFIAGSVIDDVVKRVMNKGVKIISKSMK